MRRKENRKPLPRRPGWRDIGDEFWEKINHLLSKPKPRTKKGGRPPTDQRRVLNGIFYVLRTGCQWKMLPREYGSGMQYIDIFNAGSKKEYLRKCGSSAWKNMMI